MIRRLWRALVRFGFRLLYNECAVAYDRVSQAVSLSHWRSWQSAPLQFLDDASSPVLELAHGTGNTQLDLLRAGHRTIALDRSRQMSRLARRKLDAAGLSTAFVRGDALRLPFRDACVPAIICVFPTGFIVQRACLDEMKRVLRGDGLALIVLAGTLHGGGWRRRVIGGLYRLTGQGYGLASDGEIRRMFAGHGFHVEARRVECGGSVVQLAILRCQAA